MSLSIREIENPGDFRLKLQYKINLRLVEYSAESEREKFSHEQYMAWAVNVEKGIYNWSIKEATNKKVIRKWNNSHFVNIYLSHFRSIYTNLSTQVVGMITSGQTEAKEVAFLTHQELNPERWDALIQAKSERDKYKFIDRIEASTDTFICRKCRSKRCSYYQLQTRSSDEGISTFVQCLDCSTRWKC